MFIFYRVFKTSLTITVRKKAKSKDMLIPASCVLTIIWKVQMNFVLRTSFTFVSNCKAYCSLKKNVFWKLLMPFLNSFTNFKTRNSIKTIAMRQCYIFNYLINVKVFLKRAKLIYFHKKFHWKRKRTEYFIRLLGHPQLFSNKRVNSKNIVNLKFQG